jgi:hypothetical protein
MLIRDRLVCLYRRGKQWTIAQHIINLDEDSLTDSGQYLRRKNPSSYLAQLEERIKDLESRQRGSSPHDSAISGPAHIATPTIVQSQWREVDDNVGLWGDGRHASGVRRNNTVDERYVWDGICTRSNATRSRSVILIFRFDLDLALDLLD